jgi:RNA polymerase sigma-70 factor (ECF subfamily)
MSSKSPAACVNDERIGGRSPEDQDLILRLRSHDESALEALMRKYSSHVIAVAFRVLQQRSDAEEVAQDVFWALWRAPERFDAARGPLLTWLVIVTRSRALDRLRRIQINAARENVLTTEALSNTSSSVQRSNRDRELMIEELLDRLPSEQCWVVHKAYFEGYALNEIAMMRRAPLGTIKGRARFALKKLRSEFNE